MGRLVHCGAVIADLVMTVPELPPPGGDAFATSAVTTPGGGFNVMSAAARAGMPVLYAGAHGTGDRGDLVRAALAAEGIGILHPPVPGQDTGLCVALVDARGERTFVTRLGAEMVLDAQALARISPAPGDHVYVVGYGLMAGPHVAELDHWIGGLDPGVRLVVDPAPVVASIAPDLLERVLRRTDVLSLNAREAGQVTGAQTPEAAAEALAGRIRAEGTVVVRDAARGCVVGRAGGPPVRVPSFPVEAVDTIGAGDAHVGVFLAGLHDGLSPVEAALRANAAAAIAVTRRGPATSPHRRELEDFLSAHPPRSGAPIHHVR
ncbi:PfkB family carbohydrate kinase [Marinactinospora thermotolerans]|uniref:Sugar or nucleoside kinase, ribokinase family n=1 Tax=Marinactinospora thermotolerans DSM 45154 TaxID=1122192 RepID=A0A1T4N6J2_9ACTN|nr:PfkB family carbohydrate kinase [Marinactinospora thermotolerans]SJZ74468.1 Sugar or nucleoside kinase, ribokinase family [Marinactinospora thermotolerans DSM 45154]